MQTLIPMGLLGLGHYVPETRLTNADLEKMVDTTDDWIVQRTGIRERRIAAKDLDTSRIGIRTLIAQHLELRHPRDGYVGIIDTRCSPSKIAQAAV